MTLIEFLTARIDEDAAEYRRWADGPRAGPPGDGERRGREVTAKRAILAEHGDQHECTDYTASEYPYPGCRTLRLLATIWSDHPDYDPAWFPIGLIA